MCQMPQRAPQRQPGTVHGLGALTALSQFIPSLLTLQPAAEPVLPARHHSRPGLAARAGRSAPARKDLHHPGRFGVKVTALLVLRQILTKLCAAIRLQMPGLLPGLAWPCLPRGV